MQKSILSHWNATLGIVRYNKVDQGRGLLLSSVQKSQLTIFCDADWATCPNTRRSVSGFILMSRDSLTSWKSENQIISLESF